MANSGYTTSSALADSLPAMIASARGTRMQVGTVSQLCDRVTLGEGVGTDWNEILIGELTSQAVAEDEELDNPQQLSDTLFTIAPTLRAVHTVITDRVRARISKNVLPYLGEAGQNAMQKGKDTDGLTALDGASISLGAAGTTLTSGYIAAAKSRISSNVTEPGPEPINCVMHGYGLKDLHDEIVAGVGTYVLNEGPTADVFKNGFRLPVAGVNIFEDGNISIDSSDDAKAYVWAKIGLVLVQGRSPWAKIVRNEKLGGGADEILLYDEYAYGERSAGNWLSKVTHDATAPTS